ncbi:MAG: FAD-binding oxidoreductase, partial [Acidobacteriota bacterium]
MILTPGTPRELADMLASANAAKQAVAPQGGGSKSAWGNPPTRTDLILSTQKLNRVIEHAWADMTATVEAGCTIAALQATLAEHGQRLAIDPLWPETATVGGILATNDSGALRLRFGALRDLIIGITVALPDGIIALSGGKVVKNVAGYDLPKLMTGALGTLGVITQAVFRLHPLPRFTRTLTIAPKDLDEAQRLILAIQNSQLAHSALQLRSSGTPELDILFEGTEAGIDAQHRQVLTHTAARENTPDVWSARQQLWPAADGEAIVKFSTLPSQIA